MIIHYVIKHIPTFNMIFAWIVLGYNGHMISFLELSPPAC